jgi:GT2 family glycosyltransferase
MSRLDRDRQEMADLAIVIVSTNEAHWLHPCLTSIFRHADDASLDVIVVDNESSDGTRELVETGFPGARVVSSRNRGFAHGNNRGLERVNARYSLLLNPDTEVIQGSFGELVKLLDARPEVGLVGVRQITGDGGLSPTVRRFPSVRRTLGEAMVSERWPLHPSWAGERVLDLDVYEQECECDWTSGSFMLVRREALLSAGLLDERFFIYGEEPDLCLRLKRAGWQIRHLPHMTIVHHAGKGGIRPKMVAQDTYARKQYAQKYFGRLHRSVYLGALALRHLIRGSAVSKPRRDAARLALQTLVGRAEPPFGAPPATAMIPAPAVACHSADTSPSAVESGPSAVEASPSAIELA